MSIRNVLNNLDLVISKKGQILRRPDIGSIFVKDSGICTHNHILSTIISIADLPWIFRKVVKSQPLSIKACKTYFLMPNCGCFNSFIIAVCP